MDDTAAEAVVKVDLRERPVDVFQVSSGKDGALSLEPTAVRQTIVVCTQLGGPRAARERPCLGTFVSAFTCSEL